MKLDQITIRLRSELRNLEFKPPVACVYNPLEYAWRPHADYLRRFGQGQREIVLLGMNPGPWGMVQTGVPFGDIEMVRDWLKVSGEVYSPKIVHTRRPVEGFSCHRREISGQRLWGWARATYVTPEQFFKHFFVINYCPLCFFDAGGDNRTPDRLGRDERTLLYTACDRALCAMIRTLQPRLVISIGRFAEGRARAALADFPIIIRGVSHPSGANPQASRDWGGQMNAALRATGVRSPGSRLHFKKWTLET